VRGARRVDCGLSPGASERRSVLAGGRADAERLRVTLGEPVVAAKPGETAAAVPA